jgi:hypothetical protein
MHGAANMKTIDQYIDRAIERTGLTDRQLGPFLGRGVGTVSHWRCKRAWPADDTMIALAEVAGLDPEQALIDLNIWRSSGETRRIYERLADHLAAAPALGLALALCLAGHLFFSTASTGYAAQASHKTSLTIYYGKFRRRFGTVLVNIALIVQKLAPGKIGNNYAATYPQ